MGHFRRQLLGAGLVIGVLWVHGCGGDPETVQGNGNSFGGSGGSAATGGTAGAAGSANGGTLNVDAGVGGTSSNDCPGGCPEGRFCSNGVCVLQTQCSADDDCQNDSHCELGTGCVPWGPGEKDDTCQVAIPPGNFAPSIKCEFSEAPSGDPFPSHVDVQATPMVVNFNAQSGGTPSIVVPFTYTIPGGYAEGEGVVRVLRGDDCTLEANLGAGESGYAGYLVSSGPVAVADLDGDKVAEVVARGADGHWVAFTRKSGTWGVLWTSADVISAACGGSGGSSRCGAGWSGPSIHDLDDDSTPEVIIEGYVLNGLTGATLSALPSGYTSYSQGLNPVLANLDSDPYVELTNGALAWEWNSGAWVQDTSFAGPGAGFVAVADFGAYGSSLPATNPELAVVRGGLVNVVAMDGTAVLGPIAVPGGGGGAPTISDYDGDGLPEVGVAGEAFLTVYDIDCTSSPRTGGTCSAGNACDDAAGSPGPCPEGILWSRRTQDNSSNITGSSVFDFEADGVAEVVYADECFVRVYEGTSGAVRFSQYRSSCTWYENPIVADTDGDFRADLVTPSNLACSDGVNGIACTMLEGGVDTQFPGLRCQENADCASGVCDSGLCRCTATAECCGAGTDTDCLEEGYSCAPPPSGTPGTGNTCRAAHPHGVSGIRVYQDANDRWVRSRTIWSQHAYAVTHINEDGTVPPRSTWQDNWLDPDLNNFRQNVPGVANGLATPDLTAGASAFDCGAGGAELRAPICNRGAEPIGSGISVGFYAEGNVVCSATTSKALNPGECETVSCTWADAPTSGEVDVTVIADDKSDRNECREANNQGTIPGVQCEPPA
ncbi:MAG: hypothetical protein KC766_34950 [Myxococcales bacterium]|nr:hypothetical protein [Myxococcales bacterium]